MLPKFLFAAAAFALNSAGGCASVAEDKPDYSKPPKSIGAALGAPPGNVTKTVEALKWLAPQGGETFCLEGEYPLMWTGGGSDVVQFSLIRMDIWTVVPGAPEGVFDNIGRGSWTIATSVQPGDYQMYVERGDRTDWRYSETFKIKNCDCLSK